jgi:hypothetical protein
LGEGFGREEFGKGRGGVGGKKGRWDEMRWGVGGFGVWMEGWMDGGLGGIGFRWCVKYEALLERDFSLIMGFLRW